MRVKLRQLLPILAVTAACTEASSTAPPPITTGPAPAAVATDEAPFVEGELIVKLDPTAAAVAVDVPIEIAGQRLIPVTELPSGAWLMRLAPTQRRVANPDPAAATLDAVAAVAAAPAVAYAHPNAILEFSRTPNDPYYPLQRWHYDAINLGSAWDVTTGSAAVRIAIIDTGRRNHPELTARWSPGYDFVDNDSDPSDPGTWAHGIHVAGLLGAATDNGAGTAGICWSCPLIPLRVQPTIAQAEQAVAWAAGPDAGARRAEVVNMSFNVSAATSCNTYPGLRDAITRAVNRGLVLVASAGNQHDAGGPHVPANCPGVIAVAASQPDGALAPYSNYGPGIDVVAPGGGFFNGHGYGAGVGCPADPNPADPYDGTVGAFSTWSIGTSHCMRYLSGTSMASPHVAGVAALMLSADPSLTPAQVEAKLRATAHPIACPVTGGCGAGLIDAAAALANQAPEIQVSPSSVAFPPTQVGSASSAIVTISNLGTAPLTFAAAVTAPQAFTLSCPGGPCPAAIAPGASLGLGVTFAPPSRGTHTGTLVITSNDLDEGTTLVALAGLATAPVITAAPSPLAFGSLPVGTPTTRTLTIGNAGDAPLIVTSTSVPSTYGISFVFPTVIAAGATSPMTITCDRPSVGTHDANLIIYNNSGTAAVVPLTCAATPAVGNVVLVEPASDELVIRPYQSGLVRVTNTGGAAVTITALGFSEDPDSWFTAGLTLPAVLAPGQFLDWKVACTARTRAGVHWEKHRITYTGAAAHGLLVVGCDTGPYRDDVND